MGVCQSSEDVAVSRLGRAAVGANSKGINDLDIEAAMSVLAAGQSALKSKVSLTFEASKLPNLDVGSKTDPFLVLYLW